jgi:hypothetical protein
MGVTITPRRTCPGCKLSIPITQIGKDGYCANCGRGRSR